MNATFRSRLKPRNKTQSPYRRAPLAVRKMEDLQEKMNSMQHQLDQHGTKIKANKKSIQDNAYIRNKFKVEESIARGRNKIRILNYPWTIERIRPKSRTGDKSKDYVDREEFIQKLVKAVFINHNLISQQQWDQQGSSMVTDIKPVNIRGKSGSALDITFANTELRNHIMDSLGGVRMPFFLRPALPEILNDRYNELLRGRSDLRREVSGRKLFVDLIPFSPYLQLRERQTNSEGKSVHATISVTMPDPRLDDPITHYHSYKRLPRVVTTEAFPHGAGPSNSNANPTPPLPLHVSPPPPALGLLGGGVAHTNPPTPVVGPHNNNNIVRHFSPPATGLFSGKTNLPAPVSFDRRFTLSPTAGPSSGRGSLSPAALSPNNSGNSLLAPVTGASNGSSTIFPSTDYRQGSTNGWGNNTNLSSSIQQQQQTKQAKQKQKATKGGHTPRRDLEPPRRGREPPVRDAKARHKLGLGAGQAGGVSMEVDSVDPGNFLE